MANFCEHCKHAMSAHDNHASCPQCWVAAGDCSVDPKNPCTTCEGWTRKQWARLRRSLIDARARAEQRGKQHWTVACPHVEAWILAKPVSTSASEISSQAGEGDFDDETLVGTPKQPEVQVLVVQSQNEANMATSSTLRLQVRPLRLKVRLLVLLPFKSPLFNNWVRHSRCTSGTEIRLSAVFFRPAVYRCQQYYGCSAVYCGTPAVQCGCPAVHCGCPAVHCTL